MRVAVYYNNRDIRIEERPIPKIGSGEILVKVVASGICGSDVMEWYRIKKAPAVLGHEITGEIVEVGENVRDYRVGDRVFVSHHVPCNTCHYCLNGHHTACETLHKTNYDPGGFAEYIRVPEINVDRGVYLLPDEISFEDGTFIEPLACVVRGQRLLRIQPGESILIIGSGISGLLHINLARITGAGRVIATDISEYRLKASIRFGVDTVIHAEEDIPSRLHQVNKNRLADHVIICTGAPSAIAQALQSVDSGGTVLFFAVPEPGINVSIPITDFWRREVTMMTSYGASPSDIAVAIKLISSRKVHVNEMITHRLSLSETGLGFQLVADANESIKVIIEPSR